MSELCPHRVKALAEMSVAEFMTSELLSGSDEEGGGRGGEEGGGGGGRKGEHKQPRKKMKMR